MEGYPIATGGPYDDIKAMQSLLPMRVRDMRKLLEDAAAVAHRHGRQMDLNASKVSDFFTLDNDPLYIERLKRINAFHPISINRSVKPSESLESLELLSTIFL